LKILLVDPNDVPDRGPWASERWDLIVDLGRGGSDAYARWGEHFRCPVFPLDSQRIGLAEFQRVRAFMRLGARRLLDREGLDWWELIAIMLHDKIDAVGALRRLASSIDSRAKIHATRGGFCVAALGLMRDTPVDELSTASSSLVQSIARYWRIARKFPLPQLLEIAGDKYDPVYSARSLFARRRKDAGKPVVLLPSAYINVTRLALAYSKMLPETEFLLVTTRRSGQMSRRPPNVNTVGIAGYVTGKKSANDEHCDLLKQWSHLRNELEADPDVAVLLRMGVFDSFPTRLREGLVLRDAWLEVLESEMVTAVLCGDDSNPITHMPVLLARPRNIPTIVSHHGALDGRHLIKQNHADVILAKGKMEEDYLVRVCGVPSTSVEIGAPDIAPRSVPGDLVSSAQNKSSIVFFSESYEVLSGRTKEFYGDVLPRLANLSLKYGVRLMIKLHPAESRQERRSLVREVLSTRQMEVTTLIDGPLVDGLLDDTWFGVTVLSTTAVDCAKRGIPCFFCKWLEYWPYGYIDQFERFGVGRSLITPEEIDDIPRILETYSIAPEVHRNVWQPIAPERLRILLGKLPTDHTCEVDPGL
jgi:hypothetical protein